MWPEAPGWEGLDDVEYDQPLSGSVAGAASRPPSRDELRGRVLHEAGLSDPPPKRRTRPDTSALRDRIGL